MTQYVSVETVLNVLGRTKMIPDREKTILLTKLGYLQLKNMGCFEVSTEVNVPTYYKFPPTIFEKDPVIVNQRHHIIDLIGIEYEYLPPSKQCKEKVWSNIFKEMIEQKIIKKPILRGIEVKVSRSDFKNGFIHVGCHYNYLMVPKGLIQPKEVHKYVGIIEVDLDNCGVRKFGGFYSGYELIGVKITRNPKRQPVSDLAIERCRTQISTTLTNQTKRWLVQTLSKSTKGTPKTSKIIPPKKEGKPHKLFPMFNDDFDDV